ncbi:hypothetical protein [Salipiger sp.]|uniref:hypothetical protein n=1 Tax=Salipiger sp. TaxID=2078585 RepID=UPI003A978BBE
MFALLSIALVGALVATAFSYNIAIQALWRHAPGDPPREAGIAGRSGEASERIRSLIEKSRRLVDQTSERVRCAERNLAEFKRTRDLCGAATLTLVVAAPAVGWTTLGAVFTVAAAVAAIGLGISLARVEHQTDRVRKLREALDDYERDEWVWRKEYEQTQAPAKARKSGLMPA